MKTTKTIAGRKITMTRGQRYMAGRPFASRGRKTYPVTIYQISNGFSFQNGVATIDGLTYDQPYGPSRAFSEAVESL